MRTSFKGAIIIAEGDTDIRVYRRVLGSSPRFLPAKGKSNALFALEILEKCNFSGFVVLVDADFWRLDGIPLSSANLIITDHHDLETMILASNALDELLGEFGSSQKIGKLTKHVRRILLDCGQFIGLLRWLCSRLKDKLKISVNNVNLGDFIDKQKLAINREVFIKEVCAKSEGCTISIDDLRSKLYLLEASNPDPWQVCSGHDLVVILGIGLRFLFGNNKGKQARIDIIEASLRLAYTAKDFSSTIMWEALGEWEKAYPLFPVRS
jgi:hypothetical protein